MTNKLIDLNERVTAAILRAERLPRGSIGARDAYGEVSRLEEQIARLTAPIETQGEVARIGAAMAAIKAGEPLRALMLIYRYRKETLSPEAEEDMDRLELEARSARRESL